MGKFQRNSIYIYFPCRIIQKNTVQKLNKTHWTKLVVFKISDLLQMEASSQGIV